MTPSLQRLLGYLLCSVLPLAILVLCIYSAGLKQVLMSLAFILSVIAIILSFPLGLTLLDMAKRRAPKA